MQSPRRFLNPHQAVVRSDFCQRYERERLVISLIEKAEHVVGNQGVPRRSRIYAIQGLETAQVVRRELDRSRPRSLDSDLV